MSTEIKVPALPESVADATILQWHKAPGEPIKRDENMVDLETDKIVLEVPAPADGIIAEIKAEIGSVVSDNDLLCLFAAGAIATSTETTTETAAENSQVKSENAAYGPAAKALLKEHKLEAGQVTATGNNGRLLKEDVLNYIAAPKAEAVMPTIEATAPAAPAATPTQPKEISAEREQVREPMSRLRQTIAKRLVNAQQSTAMLTTFNEVDTSAIMNMRKKYQETFVEQHQSKLGFMSFFVKASVAALQRFPMVNAHIDGTDVIKSNFCDIGIAVSSPRGLVVPIIRDAQDQGFADIELGIRDFGSRAQTGSLSMDELIGGTFTITNGGTFGSMLSTPILNPPQSAILGMHTIQQRPVAANGEVIIRPMMYLALSYDHRIVDGKEAVQFLVSIKDSVEDPARLLLELK